MVPSQRCRDFLLSAGFDAGPSSTTDRASRIAGDGLLKRGPMLSVALEKSLRFEMESGAGRGCISFEEANQVSRVHPNSNVGLCCHLVREIGRAEFGKPGQKLLRRSRLEDVFATVARQATITCRRGFTPLNQLVSQYRHTFGKASSRMSSGSSIHRYPMTIAHRNSDGRDDGKQRAYSGESIPESGITHLNRDFHPLMIARSGAA